MYLLNKTTVSVLVSVLLLAACAGGCESESSTAASTPGYTRTLLYNGFYQDGIAGVDGLDGALFVVVSPDNKNVYVSGKNDASIAVFDRNLTTGALSYSTYFADGVDGVEGLKEVRNIAVSPDNKNVYAVGRDDNSLVVFDRDASTGALTYSTCFYDGIDGVEGLDGPHGLTVSPDNRNVYVSTIDDDSLVVFDRDTSTGALTYSTCFYDGIDGVDGLNAAREVVVSPDNKNVYVTGDLDNALAVFDRDTATGGLTFSTLHADGVNGIEGLVRPAGLAISPDNKSVYVTAIDDDFLVVFDRDTSTGALTYSAYFKNNIDGVEGLDNPANVAVSPDDRNVYIASYLSGSLVVFDRNTQTGALTYSTYFKDDTDGIEGLSCSRGVAISPDGMNIYVTGRDDNALAQFLSVKVYE